MLETIVAFTLATASTVPAASIASAQPRHAHSQPVTVSVDAQRATPESDLKLRAPPHAYLMVEALRRGGLILFVRHGITSLDNADQKEVTLSDCKTQRSLSIAGRALATEAGQAIRELRLPIGPVFTSAYWRCRQTADLMFGNGLRVADLAVDDLDADSAGDRLLSVMARIPPPVDNTVLVGHSPSAMQVYGVIADEGETLVIQPAHEGKGPTLIGHITATQWGDIVRDYRQYGERITQMVNAAVEADSTLLPGASVTEERK